MLIARRDYVTNTRSWRRQPLYEHLDTRCIISHEDESQDRHNASRNDDKQRGRLHVKTSQEANYAKKSQFLPPPPARHATTLLACSV